MDSPNNSQAILVKIRSLRSSMGKAEVQVCDYILKHPEEVVYLSVSDLASRSGVSDATVIRVSQKIGAGSYQDLKITLAQELVSPLQAVNEEIRSEDDTATVTEKVFRGILHTLDMTYKIQNAAALETAAELLMNAERIAICGLGNSHAIAADIQHKFMRLGLNATAYADSHLQVICASFLKKGDVFFAVSHSGSSREIVHAAKLAKESGAMIVSLTNAGRNPMADISDVALHTDSQETRYRRVALSSRIAQMAIVDVLYTMIAMRKPDVTEGFFRIEKGLVSSKY